MVSAGRRKRRILKRVHGKEQRQQQMRRWLRQMALTIDADARFQPLADRLGVGLNTVLRWIEVGCMPRTRAKGVAQLFPEIASVDELSGDAL